MLYLSIPQQRRDRVTHEKARSLRVGELRWVRLYTDDLDDLADEPVTVRFLDDALVRLASKRGWLIPYDHRRIANRLGLRTTDVAKAIKRLLTLRRLEIVQVDEQLSTGGNVQIGLDLHAPLDGSESRVTTESVPESLQSQHRVSTDSAQSQPHDAGEVSGDVAAQIQASLGSSDPNRLTDLTQERGSREEEKERRKSLTSNGTVASKAPRAGARAREAAPDYAAAATADQRDIVNRLAGLVCAGSPTSIAVVRYECLGLPDAAIARTIESTLGRRPPPRDRAEYAVGTLRALRLELSLTDTRPRITREPELR